MITSNLTVASPADTFASGLVFGFDLGTASIGYAVRRGDKILDLGVLICPEEVGDLSERRNLRRQRRTLRAKKHRREWLAAELTKLGFPKPSTDQQRCEPQDPIAWRIAALRGETLAPWKIHAALAHLCRRRGYLEVPWVTKSDSEAADITDISKGKPNESDEEGVVKAEVEALRAEMREHGVSYPCELLERRRLAAGRSPTDHWARHLYWPRELIEIEFIAITRAQNERHPQLAEKASWLLYGDTRTVEKHGGTFHVYDTRQSPGGQNPGALGLRWPRFNNRSPDLDRFRPYDEQGRPQHVVSRDRQVFQAAQFEVALLNLRVNDARTGESVSPAKRAQVGDKDYSAFVADLRREWEKPNKKGEPTGKVSEAALKKIAKNYANTFTLKEDHPALTPMSASGRAAFSSPTLEKIRRGELLAPDQAGIQPILVRHRPDGTAESPDQALTRFLGDITAPLVRHRLLLFSRLLDRLAKQHGVPDMIVSEAVRSLALGKKAKAELQKRQKDNADGRETAKGELRKIGGNSGGKAIRRYRLWKEAGCVCPFCLQPISPKDLIDHQKVDIEHLVPRAKQVSNEWDNLTVAHTRCNREHKRDRTPYQAFHDTEIWPHLVAHAQERFHGKKREIFLSPDAESLLERNADLQQTAYIARLIRATCLIRFGWVGADGRDPLVEKDNPALRFQITNGALTSRLRSAWQLNGLLHPLPAGVSWDDLTEEEQSARDAKNRGDHRHHALDALVIANTLPWAARRSIDVRDRSGASGWWRLDPTTRRELCERMPVSLRAESVRPWIERIRVDHHVSRSPHKRGYALTIYGESILKTTDAKGNPSTEKHFTARKLLSALKPSQFASIFPPALGNYIALSFSDWEIRQPEESASYRKKLAKSTQQSPPLPKSFIESLCFSAFQKWREAGCPPTYTAPLTTKVPIRSVKVEGVSKPEAVFRAHPKVNGYLERDNGFKEVRIHRTTDGKGISLERVTRFKCDKIPPTKAVAANSVIATLRVGEVYECKKKALWMNESSRYILKSISSPNSEIAYAHLNSDGNKASDLGAEKKAINTNTLLRALGLIP